ncbi:MAG TPA: glutamine-hydrolyzing GMP synthase, partial [Acidimicrobiia bacterium]|nr:glutamine-hydrolyzing GMP synthase [Acidimicrobiia bacterium]
MPTSQRVLVVDFGAQYAQLIARRVREAHVFSEIVPRDVTAAEVEAAAPTAIILSGGPASVYADDAYRLDPGIFDLGIPVMGICYGHQVIADTLGGTVERTDAAEFGRTPITVADRSWLFSGLPVAHEVWMSHRDAVVMPPEGFTVTAATPGSPVAAMESVGRRIVGVQFHPEVAHSPHGQAVLERFLYDVCGASPSWTAESIVDQAVARVAAQVGDAEVICALSGGVDSAVAAAIVHRAVGDRLTCVFVDHGLLREGERAQVEAAFRAALDVPLEVVD